MSMCDFGSISLSNAEGKQLACCNVKVEFGKKRCEVEQNADSDTDGGENDESGNENEKSSNENDDELS